MERTWNFLARRVKTGDRFAELSNHDSCSSCHNSTSAESKRCGSRSCDWYTNTSWLTYYSLAHVWQTLGSGKTLAFLIPLLELLLRRADLEPWKAHQVGAIVVSPTRELALQTNQVLEQLLEHTKVRRHC